MTTEERLSRLEGAYEQVDQRLGDLTQALGSLRQEMMGRFEALHSEATEQHTALRSEMTALRSETSDQVSALRSETTAQFTALRSEMNSRFNILLVVGAGAWVTTVGLIVGLYLQS